jgi:AcrR family transcriptional regulator
MPQPNRKPAAVRREEIARAVLRIIGERGLTSVTTANLAAEVGLTTGALFRHFASQDEILREATRHAVSRIEATFPDEALPPLERLLALARNRISVLGADPGLAWFLRSDQAALALPADAARLLFDLAGRSKAFLLAALREAAAEGRIRDDISPGILLVPVLGTIHTLIGMSGVRGRSEASASNSEQILAALLRLLSPQDPPPPAKSPGTRKPKKKTTTRRR